jgi:predicted esterase
MKRISVFANFAKWGPDGGRPAYRTRLLRFTLLVLVASFDPANAATTVRLPGSICAADDTVFAADFAPWSGVPSDPSHGSGGAGPGAASGEVFVPGLGSEPGGRQVFHLYVPSTYTATRAWPLVIALHGAAGSHAQAGTAARAMRDAWSGIAESQGFIVVAPVSSGAQGGWIVPPGAPTDYDAFAAMLARVDADYNIERSRTYLWGFSAGGHVAYDLVVNATDYATPLDEENLAGFAVSAGVLAALACQSDTATRCEARIAALPRVLPLDIHVGSTDPLLPYARADRDRFLGAGWRRGSTLGYHEFAGGHTYTPAQLGEAWAQLCRFARGP